MSVAPVSSDEAPLSGEGGRSHRTGERGPLSLAFEVGAWLLVSIVNGWLHFWRLGERTFHHDEALHAYYSWFIQAYESHSYNPMMHGPSQLYLAAWIAPLFEFDRVGMRALSAICGTLLPLTLLFFRTRSSKEDGGRFSLSPEAALLAAGWITVSAPLLYYGRFFRNDIPFLFLCMLALGLWYRAWRRFSNSEAKTSLNTQALLAGSFFFCGVLFAFKENAIIFTFILGVFALIWLMVNKISLHSLSMALRDIGPALLVGSGFAALWGLLVFTDFTQRPEGPVSLLKRTLGYWVEQNKEQRLGGPFHYYLPLLGVYHLYALVVVLFLTNLRLFSLIKSATKFTIGGGFFLAFLVAFVFDYLLLPPEIKKVLWNIFHVDGLIHFMLGACAFFWALWATIERLRAGRAMHAFWIHWTLWSFMIYSYAGEKVPWLSVYLVFPMLIWAAVEIADLLKRLQDSARRFSTTALKFSVLILTAGALYFSAFNCWRAIFEYYSNPRELLVYNHTSSIFQQMVDGIIELEREESIHEELLEIGFRGDAGWPLHYDFRDLHRAASVELEELSAPAPWDDSPRTEYDILILNSNKSLDEEIALKYEWLEVPFRQFWIPPKWPLPIFIGWSSWRPPPEKEYEYLIYYSGEEQAITIPEMYGILWRYFTKRIPFYNFDWASSSWGAGPHALPVSIGISQNLLQRSNAARAFWEDLGSDIQPYLELETSLPLN